MTKLIAFACFIIISDSLWSQPGKKPANPVIKIVRPPSILKTLNDSASYAVGMSIAGFCKQHGINEPNKTLICRSFTDIRDNNPFLLTETMSNEIVNKLLIGKTGTDPSLTPSHDTTQTVISANDSVSYAIGLNHASFFKQQEITSLDTVFISRAINDILGNKPLQFNEQAANRVMNKMIILMQEEKAKPVIDAGRVFLANNKKRPEVKVTKTGLQYEMIRQGKGIKPLKTDTFICHYRGTLIDGTEFDASYNRNEPLKMAVSQVIRGWIEGLQMMPVGSKFKLYVPYELGYGPFDNPPIPGGSVLIFDMELLNIKKPKALKKTVKPAR